MKEKIRKLLCMALALCLVLSLAPAVVLAEGEENNTFRVNSGAVFQNRVNDAIAYLQETDHDYAEVVFDSDLTLTSLVTIGGDEPSAQVGEGKILMIRSENYNRIEAGNEINPAMFCVNSMEGIVAFSNMELQCVNSNGINVANCYVCLMNMDIRNYAGVDHFGVHAVANEKDTTLFIKNVKIQTEDQQAIDLDVSASDSKNLSVRIYGGRRWDDGAGCMDYFTRIGTIKNTGAAVRVFNGRFGFDPTDMLDSKSQAEHEEGLYFVYENDNVVACIGGVYYFTDLQSAVDAAGTPAVDNDNSIDLWKDISLHDTLIIENKSVELRGGYDKGNRIISAAGDFNTESDELVCVTGTGYLKLEQISFSANEVSTGVKLHKPQKSDENCFTDIDNCSFSGFSKAIKNDCSGMSLNGGCFENNALDIWITNSETDNTGFGYNINDVDGLSIRLLKSENGGPVQGGVNYCTHVMLDIDGDFDVQHGEMPVYPGVGSYFVESISSTYISGLIDEDQYVCNTVAEGEAYLTEVAFKPETALCSAVVSFNGEAEIVEYFNDINRAVSSAIDGGTVRVYQNVTTENCIEIQDGKTLTIVGETEGLRPGIIANPQDNYNDFGHSTMLYIAGDSHVKLENISLDASYRVENTIQVECDQEWENQSTLEMDSSTAIHSWGLSVRFNADEYDHPMPVTIGVGCCIENVGMGDEGCYMDAFIDHGTHMWFDYRVQKDDEGAYGYNPVQDQYFRIEDPDFPEQRYFTYYVVRQSYIQLTGHTYNAQSTSDEAYFTGIYNLKVEVHPDEDLGLAGIGVQISYDPNLFTLRNNEALANKGVVKGSMGGNFEYRVDQTGNYINISWAGNENIKQEFTLVTLSFDVLTPTWEQIESDINNTDAQFGIQLIPTGGNPSVSNKNIVYKDGDEAYETHCDLVGLTTKARYMPGDVNGDLTVNLIDVVAILKHVVGYELDEIVTFNPTDPFNADTFRLSGDVDEDGYLTILDAVKVLQMANAYLEAEDSD